MEKLIKLMQDLFILQGIKAKADKEELRKVLSIDKKRINKISKLFSQ